MLRVARNSQERPERRLQIGEDRPRNGHNVATLGIAFKFFERGWCQINHAEESNSVLWIVLSWIEDVCAPGKPTYDEFMSDRPAELEPDPVIEWYNKKVDRAAIRENLKLTVEQRLDNLMRLQKLAEELRLAGREDAIKNLTTAILKEDDWPPANGRHRPPALLH